MKLKTAQTWKITSSVIGLLALLAILIAVNAMLKTFRFRKDMTEEKIYTLSDGTRAILKKLKTPVTLKFYFSSSSPEIPMPFKYFAREIKDILREYKIAGGRNIIIETYDPKPDSDAEEWAQRYGLIDQSMGMMNTGVYLGLVAVKGDNAAAIPFIDPRGERLIEYNITRMIVRIDQQKKPVAGVMSSLPVMGVSPSPFSMTGQPGQGRKPAWVSFQELSQDYDIRQLSPELDKIDADIDVLIIVHPKNFSDKTFYAIDQFVLRGGRLLAFVDPFCLADANLSNMQPSTPSSDLIKLTRAWGIKYDPRKVLADLNASTQIMQANNKLDNSPVFLTMRRENINQQDIITSQIESLVMACAGTFSGNESASTSIDPLIMSSRESELVNPMIIQMGSESIRRDFKSGNEQQNLAIRLHGRFKTAFPDGKPRPENQPNDDTKTGSQDTETADQEKKETDTAEHLISSTEPTTIILAGDVDMLYDPFTVQEVPFLGNSYQPINDNINFLVNAVDQLSGSADMSAIRTRGQFERPFDRVLALQHSAQKKWLVQEQALQEKLESTRERLQALQSKKDKNQQFILSNEQQSEIERFRQEEITTRRELKQVRKNLREDIERLGIKVKIINIVLIPIIVSIVGLMFACYRRSRLK